MELLFGHRPMLPFSERFVLSGSKTKSGRLTSSSSHRCNPRSVNCVSHWFEVSRVAAYTIGSSEPWSQGVGTRPPCLRRKTPLRGLSACTWSISGFGAHRNHQAFFSLRSVSSKSAHTVSALVWSRLTVQVFASSFFVFVLSPFLPCFLSLFLFGSQFFLFFFFSPSLPIFIRKRFFCFVKCRMKDGVE